MTTPLDRTIEQEEQSRRYGELITKAEGRAELVIRELFARGFAGEAVKLPHAMLGRAGEWRRYENTPFAEACSLAADHDVTFDVLLKACRAKTGGDDATALQMLDLFMHSCATTYCAAHIKGLALASRDEDCGDALEGKL